MKGKKITLIFDSSPFTSVKTAEGIRMGLGMTICNDDVSLVFLGEALNVLRPTIPGLAGLPDAVKPLETLCELRKKLFVLLENSSSSNKEDFKYPVECISRNKFFELISGSDIVIRC